MSDSSSDNIFAISFEKLKSLKRDSELNRLISEVKEKGSREDLIDLIDNLSKQLGLSKDVAQNTLLDLGNLTEFKIVAPEKPVEVFNTALINYFKTFPVKTQKIYKDFTVAQIIIELENTTEVATEFTQYVLDAIFSYPHWENKKAEVWDKDKHGVATKLLLNSNQPRTILAILKLQFDRVAMLGYVEHQNINSFLTEVDDLKQLATRLADLLKGE